MIKGIVFDFDGVILESADIKTEAFRELFRAEGAEVENAVAVYHEANAGIPRLEKFRRIYAEILRRPAGEGEMASLCDRFKHLVHEKVKSAPYVDGFKEFILENRGRYRLFVASAAPQAEIEEVIESKGLGGVFDSVYGFPESKTGAIARIMSGSGFAPGEMVFVGDARADMEAAISKGIFFVARLRDGGYDFPGYSGPKIKDLTGLGAVIP